MAESQASLTGHLRPEHHAVVERYILGRLPALLRLGYQPDEDAETHAQTIREHLGALSCLPIWAIAEAMDAWVAQHNRRPTPAELRILASRAMEPVAREIEERKRAAAEKAEDDRRKQRASPEAIARILHESGFTPARLDRVRRGETMRAPQSIADLDKHSGGADPNAHWSDTAGPDDPRWDDLRRAREASPVTKMGETPKR